MNISQMQQRGSALIVSLVILTAITLGAMVAMQRSTVQIRMVSNLQHQQEISNAALGTLNYLFSQMLNDGVLQKNVLIEAEARYKASLIEDANGVKPAATFDPFIEFKGSLARPDFKAKSISRNNTTIQNLPVPDGSHFYLKGKGGCGSGCSVMHAAINTTVTAKNGMTRNEQEIGVRRIIPGISNQ